MKAFLWFLILYHTMLEISSNGCGEVEESTSGPDEMMLFDFTSLETLNGWTEQSDVVREVGMSKAVLVLQKTQKFQRGVFFTMLNPQPNGAGFAGVRTDTTFDLTNFSKICMNVRGQGQNHGYKVVLRHKGENNEPFSSYESMFQAPIGKFGSVELCLSSFEPYYRGQKRNNSEPLDTSNITNFELQVYGGVYLPVKQFGTSSLEIIDIKACK
ncbi:hypothetical protein LSTR_LSTR006082 [Laodelphax striatellus]|uniref:NADH:ubiquinone oxidoreductase intermediate-associated protein 30 domain-containing protein n=1 Tax=Laodelphax striatellus TaxID=195883 RepID=A0A482WY10_LAOST|nr:hypothetical protein LSTR_LSTR006082 [Laodelphax striatellus]